MASSTAVSSVLASATVLTEVLSVSRSPMSLPPPEPIAADCMSPNETVMLSPVWAPTRKLAEPLPAAVTIVFVFRSVPISVLVFAEGPTTLIVAWIAPVKLMINSPSAPMVASRSAEFTVVVPSVIEIVFASTFASVYVVPAVRLPTSIDAIDAVPLLPAVSARPTTAVEVASCVVDSAPVSRLSPLNVVRAAMLSTSAFSVSISSPMAVRSLVETVSLPACTVSSRMRCKMPCTSFSAPSAVCTIEMPSCALRVACRRPRTCERRPSLMESPAASSAARLMRRPLESRSSALPIFRPVMPRFRCAFSAATFRVDEHAHGRLDSLTRLPPGFRAGPSCVGGALPDRGVPSRFVRERSGSRQGNHRQPRCAPLGAHCRLMQGARERNRAGRLSRRRRAHTYDGFDARPIRARNLHARTGRVRLGRWAPDPAARAGAARVAARDGDRRPERHTTGARPQRHRTAVLPAPDGDGAHHRLPRRAHQRPGDRRPRSATKRRRVAPTCS